MTRRLAPPGVVGYSDAQAVAATNAWREVQPAVVITTPLELAGPALVQYGAITTTNLVGGEYKLDLTGVATGTNQGTQFEARLFVDGIDLFGTGPLFAFGAPGAVQTFAGSFPLQLAPGVHTIGSRVGQPTSPGTATAILLSLMLERRS